MSVCLTHVLRAEFISDEAATRCYFGALASQAGSGTHGGLKQPGRLTVGGCVASSSEAGTGCGGRVPGLRTQKKVGCVLAKLQLRKKM